MLDSARRGSPGALMLRGEAGIGKSTLLHQLCSSVDDAIVITATGIESEVHLPLAALIELLYPIRGWLDSLESPHREVLQGVVNHGESFAPVALGLAVLHCFDVLDKHHGAVVVAVDDFQWCDEASASSLQFAFRRLTDERVVFLLAARSGETVHFDGAIAAHLVGVDDESSRQILSSGGEVSAAVASRARVACGGNPLALKELGRILSPEQRRGSEPLPDPIPMGERLTTVMRSRVAEVPVRTQRALVVLALTGWMDRAAMADVYAGFGVSACDLTIAEECGILRHEPGGAAFVHPLLRSAALLHGGPSLTREVHRAVARALTRR